MNNGEVKAEGSANAKPATCRANEGAEGDRNRKGRVEKKDKKTVGIEDAWAGGRWDHEVGRKEKGRTDGRWDWAVRKVEP